jgi:hypothetical protein
MAVSFSAPDLTQHPPRSLRVRLGGYVMLPRILDKARAAAAGKLGEYRYTGTGHDRHFFAFTGLDHEAFKRQAATGASDSEMLAWIQTNAKHIRTQWEIEQWSHYYLNRTPDSDAETWSEFGEKVAQFSAVREDIRTWFDLLDLDDYCSFGGKA